MPSDLDHRTNRLLSLLSDADYETLRPHLSLVTLEYRKSLYEAFRPIDFVYFPIDGVASLVNTMADGAASEVGTIGSEGMVGIPVVLGDESGLTSVYVQVPGRALRMSADTFRKEMANNTSLRNIVLRYVHAFFNQVAQSAACAHVHKVDQRCCRWLLMTRDRMPSDEFLLTQEFLAMMLGIQRASVSGVMMKLRKAKMVRYSRGHVTILDHAGLKRRACECYEVSKMEFDQLLGDTPKAPRTDKTNRRVGKAG
jgi:CRP-like cAMP-binding protein